MSQNRHFDAIIVGAGPAGSSCATTLARMGLEVLLIDKSKFPRDKICGDCINPGCWSFFDFLGASEGLRSLDLRPIKSIHIVTPRKKEISLKIPPDSIHPFFSIRRSILDDLLLRCATREGAAFLGETSILDAFFDGNWNVLVRGKNGNESYRCTYLVGADGRNSAVATKIGAWSRSIPGIRRQRRIGIQCQTKYVPAVGSEVRLGTMKHGYFGIVNVSDDCANVAMVVNADEVRKPYWDLSEFLEEAVCEHPIIGWEIGHAGHFSKTATTFPISPVRRYWVKPQAFLAGDARQTVEPFTGEGVFFALQDGYRTALEILPAFGKSMPVLGESQRSPWVSRILSPILCNREVTDLLLGSASHFPSLTRMIAAKVLRNSFGENSVNAVPPGNFLPQRI